MEYAFTEIDGQAGILLSGRFTYDDSQKFHALLADWNFAEQPNVVVDFQYLTFLDSTAIGMLFVLATHCRDAKGAVTVVNAQPYIIQTMRRAALEQHVTIR